MKRHLINLWTSLLLNLLCMKGKFQRLKLKEATFGKKYQLTREVTDTLDVERLVTCMSTVLTFDWL